MTGLPSAPCDGRATPGQGEGSGRLPPAPYAIGRLGASALPASEGGDTPPLPDWELRSQALAPPWLRSPRQAPEGRNGARYAGRSYFSAGEPGWDGSGSLRRTLN